MIKTAVAILNWNGCNFLEKFLPSVIQHSEKEATVFVIDNASTDNSIEFLKNHYPEVRIIQNKENGGFSKGYNDGLKEIEAEYFVLLNSDVEVTTNWITPIIKLMDADRNIAACQPKIKSFVDKSKFEYAGACGGFMDKNFYPFCRGRIFDSIEEDNGQYDQNTEVFWASGASLFIRAELYKKIGGLDEDFFAHMEEIDLCWRLKNEGHKIMVCPESTVYHLGGGTLSKINPRKTFLNFRNNLFIITKNCNSRKLFFSIAFRMILDGIAAAKFLFSGNATHALAVLKAHFSFYASIQKMMKKRKNTHHKTVSENIYKGSIVWAYYLNGIKKFSALKFNQQ